MGPANCGYRKLLPDRKPGSGPPSATPWETNLPPVKICRVSQGLDFWNERMANTAARSTRLHGGREIGRKQTTGREISKAERGRLDL